MFGPSRFDLGFVRFAYAALTSLAVACGGPIVVAETPPAPTEMASAAPVGASADAGAAPSTMPFHTITITQCTRDRDACQRAGSATAPGAPYRVAFGSGLGTVRMREQAVADLYREIKNRTDLGTHLAAASHHRDRAVPDSGALEPPVEPRPAAATSDPMVDAAYQLIDAVDAQGEVTLDVAHGRRDCKLSLTSDSVDAAPRRCLLVGDPRPGRNDPEGPRGREEKFGR
jgi:hypothetical protein